MYRFLLENATFCTTKRRIFHSIFSTQFKKVPTHPKSFFSLSLYIRRFASQGFFILLRKAEHFALQEKSQGGGVRFAGSF